MIQTEKESNDKKTWQEPNRMRFEYLNQLSNLFGDDVADCPELVGGLNRTSG
jgi:hypothetical protein